MHGRCDGPGSDGGPLVDARGRGVYAEARHVTPVGDGYFFTTKDGGTGTALWHTDGISAGTERLALGSNGRIAPGAYQAEGAGQRGFERAAIGTTLVFAGSDPAAGEELWRSDGTPEGTVRLQDLRTATDSNPGPVVEAGEHAYFTTEVSDPGTGGVVTRLWRTDGTEAGTEAVGPAGGPSLGASRDGLTA